MASGSPVYRVSSTRAWLRGTRSARSVGRAVRSAIERASAAGVDLVVAAVIGPGSTVVAHPVSEPVAAVPWRRWRERGHVLDVDTPHGPARVHLHAGDEPAGALVLGHGAGGGVAARDLVAATEAAQASGVSVALVEQPYRVAGRRSPAPAGQLDAAWVAVVEHLRGGTLGDLPLVVGGRSSGARVACRTAAQTGAVGVLCLAFPVHPPGRARRRRGCPSSTPWPSRRSSCRAPAIRSGCRPPAPAARGRHRARQPQPHGRPRDAARGGRVASWARSSAWHD